MRAAATYIFARTVACPRTGKRVPLVSDWALQRGSKPVAVRLVTERSGDILDEPEFEIVEGAAARFDTKKAGTWSRGKGVSPWDQLVIDSGYIKAEAQAGRMGEVLYAVANRTATGRGFPRTNRNRSAGSRGRGDRVGASATAMGAR